VMGRIGEARYERSFVVKLLGKLSTARKRD
jgi:hypothetical protein